jgi:hypothetical protein
MSLLPGLGGVGSWIAGAAAVAVAATKMAFIVAGTTTFTIPADFGSLVSVECVGSGSGTSDVGGGCGGAYAKIVADTLTAGQTVSVAVGNGSPTSVDTSWRGGVCMAKAAVYGNPGTPGLASASVGTTKYSGGQGASGVNGTSYGGGGGSAGPFGNGGYASALAGGGNGGGANASGTTGGNNNLGTGGGASGIAGTNGGGGGQNAAGSQGAEWDSTHGTAGGHGAGGSQFSAGYGGSSSKGGSAGPGLIVFTYIAATGGTPGTIPSGTSLLLHFEGSTFLDSSASVKTITAAASISTAAAKFGASSGLFSATAQNVVVAPSSDFEFGTGDFTIAMWVKRSSTASMYLADPDGSGSGAGNGHYTFYINVSGELIGYNAQVANSFGSSGANLSDGAWHHVAWTRASGMMRLFVDGTLVASMSSTVQMGVTGAGLWVGSSANGSGVVGNIDELIVVKGSALWIAAFTPPTTAYTAASGSTPVASASGWSVTDFAPNQFSVSADKKLATAVSISAYAMGRGESFQTTGRRYFEVKRGGPAALNGSSVNDGWGVGLGKSTANLLSYLGADANSIGLWDGYHYYNGGSGAQYAKPQVGQYLGILADLDARTVSIYLNGTLLNTRATIPTGALAPLYMAGTNATGNGMLYTINTGDSSFAFAPTGVAAYTTWDGVAVAQPVAATTINPSDKGPDLTLSNGNLTTFNSSAASWEAARATVAKSSGSFGFSLVVAGGTNVFVGLATALAPLTNYLGSDGTAYSAAAYAANGNMYQGAAASGTPTTWGPGDVIYIGYNAGVMYAFKNGTLFSTTTLTQTGAAYFPAISMYGGMSVTVNFNASSPAGYSFLPWA